MSRSRTASTDGVEVVPAGFVDYLREQRGVSSLTVDAYVSDARRLVEHRENGRLRELTASEVCPERSSRGGRGNPQSIGMSVPCGSLSPGQPRRQRDPLLLTGGTVTITASVTDGHANLAVTDQGPGFPPEFPPIAFDRFTRADAARTRHPDDREPAPRSGLGLAIVAAVIAAHHGTATAGGAQVIIHWPLPDTGSPSPSRALSSPVFSRLLKAKSDS